METFPMNAGDGPQSYSCNSSYQVQYYIFYIYSSNSKLSFSFLCNPIKYRRFGLCNIK